MSGGTGSLRVLPENGGDFFVARENSGDFFRGTGILPVPRMRFGVLCAGEWYVSGQPLLH